MTAKTITFAVQIGSGGFEIARTVAEGLKYRYYDWEVTSRAAAEAGVSPETLMAAEQSRSRFESIMEKLMSGSPLADDVLGSPSAATMAMAIRSLTSGDYRRVIEHVVKELGEQGEVVIVGHASQIILRGMPGVLKVLVTGSPDRRVERLAAEANLSQHEARTAVELSDRERIGFFKQVYRLALLEAPYYDLTLNTDELPVSVAADLVLTAAATMPGLAPEAKECRGEQKRPSMSWPTMA